MDCGFDSGRGSHGGPSGRVWPKRSGRVRQICRVDAVTVLDEIADFYRGEAVEIRPDADDLALNDR